MFWTINAPSSSGNPTYDGWRITIENFPFPIQSPNISSSKHTKPHFSHHTCIETIETSSRAKCLRLASRFTGKTWGKNFLMC